jgi:hypothetical protein
LGESVFLLHIVRGHLSVAAADEGHNGSIGPEVITNVIRNILKPLALRACNYFDERVPNRPFYIFQGIFLFTVGGNWCGSLCDGTAMLVPDTTDFTLDCVLEARLDGYASRPVTGTSDEAFPDVGDHIIDSGDAVPT